MTDKEKIRAFVENLKNDALQKKEGCKRRGLEKIMHQIGAYNKVLYFIDSMPAFEEEPVHCTKADVDAAMAELAEQCRKFTEEYKKSADDILAEMRGEEPVSNPIDFEKELYKAFGQVKDFTLGMRIAKWFYDMGKNSQEPVSEDLRQVAYFYACKCHPLVINCGEESPNPEVKEAVVYGAQWQKKQDQSIIELAEDHAMLAGMEKMKEQMMKDAKSGVGNNDNYIQFDDGTWIDLDPSMKLNPAFDIKEGEKVKVIVIKEG